jgi:cell division protein FtsW
MKNTFNAESAALARRTDHTFIASVFLLTGLGFVVLYSASYGYKNNLFEDGWKNIGEQLPPLLIGLVAFIFLSCFSLRILRKMIFPFVLVTIVLCLLPFNKTIGIQLNGAKRWIEIFGFTIQPSEFVKLVLPFYIAHVVDKKQDRSENAISVFLLLALLTFIFCIIIFLQNDFSTAIFILLNVIFLLFLAEVKIKYFLYMLGIIGPIAIFMIFLEEYRINRILSFADPLRDPYGTGDQVRKAVQTIASGEFWGKGIGQGARRISNIAEVQADFIFAPYAEEFGFIGVILFFALAVLFAIRGYKIALRSEDIFRKLLVFGLVTMIISQMLLHIGVNIGAFPTTGIPLPFFSSGGTSLAVTLAMAGIIVNVSQGKKQKELSYDNR